MLTPRTQRPQRRAISNAGKAFKLRKIPKVYFAFLVELSERKRGGVRKIYFVQKLILNFCALIFVLSSSTACFAGEADVLAVKIQKTGEQTFNFTVTVKHGDEGWDHYANQWEVLGNDGAVLGTRVLYHPHVGEQPFTRSLSGVKIPEGVSTVTVRARDSVHGYGGKEMRVELKD